jgi:hypothetical protein
MRGKITVLPERAFLRAPLVGDFPERQRERTALMRLANIRVLAGCLILGGSLGWGLVSGPEGIPAASALTAASAAMGSQCEPLPADTSASPSASPSSPVELCVSVQASQSSIAPGQTASYTVQVSTENGPASGVSVTLTATPQGQQPEFTSLCPSGNGTATCTIGSLGSSASPAAYQVQAQIPVASSATSVTSVTLTATADAATTAAMSAMPAAAAAVTVSAPAASPTTAPATTAPASTAPATTARASTAPATTARASTAPAPVTPAIRPALAATVPLGAMPATSGASTPPISPVNISSALPVITPAASPAADVGTPAARKFAVVIGMSAATAQLVGFGVLGLVFLLAATKLARDQLATRRTKKKEAGLTTQEGEGTGKKRFGFPRPGHLARLRRRHAAPRHGRHHGSEAQSDVGALRPGLESRHLIRDHEEPVAAGLSGPGGSQRGQGVITAPAAPDHAPQQEPWIYRMP